MKRIYLLISFLFVLVLLLADARAVGVLFGRPRWSDQEFQKLWIKKVETTVEIQDQIAVTHVDQTFYNEMDTSIEAVYIFPLPENAMITELVYWFNNQRYVASIRERQAAIDDYNKKVRQWLDPAILEYLGDNLFRLRIVPVNAKSEVRTEITYAEPLQYDLGKISYQFLLNTLDLSPKPLETVSVLVDAFAQQPFRSFDSPSHKNSSATHIDLISENHYRLFFGDENFYPDKDLDIVYELTRDEVDMRILTYTPSPADSFGTESYYAIWITPPDQISEEEIIPKDILFTVDVSSSMEGLRISQVKEALNYFIDLLQPYDRFNIVTFGTFTGSFKEDLVIADTQNLQDAKDFVHQIYALGMTNIEEALQTSLDQSFADTTSKNIIFLTDGDPTWGETNVDTILQHVQGWNTNDVRIFSFGVGEDIKESFLTRLARQNHGYAKFIASDDSIALVVNDHFNRISKPVMTDITLDMGDLDPVDIYPKFLDDLFWGSQVMQMGLYQSAGTFDIKLSGNMRQDQVFFDKLIAFPDTLGGHRFIPRLWARAKINYILEQMMIYGESQELIDQIIELSLRYQILTKYTAFYSDPTEENPNTIEDDPASPEVFTLYQNYPNPFNPETVIRYRLPKKQSFYHVIIRIYDVLGKLVCILVDENQPAGEHQVTWTGRNLHGDKVPSGIYYYSLEAGNYKAIKKMALIR